MASPSESSSRGSQTLVALASLVVIVAGMRAASELIVPFLLAAFLAVICLPPLVWMKKRGAPNWLCVLLMAGAFVVVSLVLAAMVRNSAAGLTVKLADYRQEIRQRVDKLKSFDLKKCLDSLGKDHDETDKEKDDDKAGEQKAEEQQDISEKKTDNAAEEKIVGDTPIKVAANPDTPANAISLIESPDDPSNKTSAPPKDQPDGAFGADRLFSILTGTVTGVAGLLSNALLILLTVIFILLEAATIPAKLNAMPGNSAFSVDNLAKIIDNVNRYMAIKTMTSLATGVLVGVMLAFLGVPFATIWAMLAFFLNFVPNIGSFIAAIPAVLVALLDLGLGAAFGAAIGYVVINGVIGNVVEPRVMGHGLGLSTLVVFVSLVFWGWVLGPVGMLLSVPLTMTAKIAMESNPQTRWVAVLLGPGPPEASGA